jgi:hypothetical protein
MNGPVIKFITDSKACGLIEYMHRFKLACNEKLIEELKINQIKDYCLIGRIFWENGQIFFRKTEHDRFQFLIVSEDSNVTLSNGLGLENSTEEFEFRDRNFILWGTHDDSISGYRDERVSGFSKIDYPLEVGTRGYPILKIREYLDEKGDVVVWRFLGLTSENDIKPDDKGVLDEKG